MIRKLAILLLLAVIIMLGACPTDEPNPLIGKWLDETMSGYEFYEDLNVDLILFDTVFLTGTYSYTDTTITITVEGESATADYVIEGNTLIITDEGETYEYEKQ